MPSWLGIFLSITLPKSRCMFTLGTSLSSSHSFFILFIHSSFPLCSFLLHILLQNCLVSFASGCWFVLCTLCQPVGRIFFHYFGMSCFAWPCPGIFWVFFCFMNILIYFYQLYCLWLSILDLFLLLGSYTFHLL